MSDKNATTTIIVRVTVGGKIYEEVIAGPIVSMPSKGAKP